MGNDFLGLIEANIREKDCNCIIRVITSGGTFEGILSEVNESSIVLSDPNFPGLNTNPSFKHLILDKKEIIGFCYSQGL